MKKIKNSFSWYPRPTWYWPSHDEKLVQVNDWVRDADIAFNYIEKFDLCIQAGGACGVWPVYLSNHFKKVVTFEPVKSNYECLKKNISGYDNISFFPCGLSDGKSTLRMQIDDVEKNNCGAYYSGESGLKVPSMRIDDLKLKACDFIALDVEGYEDRAIIGATETIEKFSPVIMIEEKPLPHLSPNDHLKARNVLESIGYKEMAKIHRDVVFAR